MNVGPDSPTSSQPVIGLIGMGAMGTLYANLFSDAGWRKIHVCDVPEKFESLSVKFSSVPGITVMPDGHAVARSSDFIIYSVEARIIQDVVAQFAQSTKLGAIVAGQTSVKAPEKSAFEKHLPQDVQIVSCHSLHGPSVSPVGQPLVLIKHRASDEALALVESIFRPFRSRYIHLSYEDHDLVTANTQAVTHAAFLSMGTAWSNSLSYPWEHGYYVGGIETVKVNIMLRIYSNKWHVYAGLAILNPAARTLIDQYARSATEIFKFMLNADDSRLRDRIYAAREKVFGAGYGEGSNTSHHPILLSEHILDQFSLGKSTPDPAKVKAKANSHLSLLAMVDCWSHLHIRPFHHLSLAATPIFRLWIGVAEYLFRSRARLDAALDAALYDVSHRSDDLEFVLAARGWSQCVHFGSFELYQRRFEETASFFESRFEEANRVGDAMISAIMQSSQESDSGLA